MPSPTSIMDNSGNYLWAYLERNGRQIARREDTSRTLAHYEGLVFWNYKVRATWTGVTGDRTWTVYASFYVNGTTKYSSTCVVT